MTSISPLNNVHELGSFGNFEGKNSNEIITIKELKNFKIFKDFINLTDGFQKEAL